MIDKKKKGLGKGLSALFGDEKEAKEGKPLNIVENTALIGELSRNQFQPRLTFDETKISELSVSIKQNGLIQPIAVRKNYSGDTKYEIIAGERRWLAAQKAGLHEVPIRILDLNDNEALEVAIVENIQREDLNPIEEAKGYENLFKEHRYDQDKIAQIMGKSRSHISNTMRLLTLPADIISMINEGQITAGQARPLIGLGNASAIAEEIVSKKLSARAIENLVKEKKGSKNKSSSDSNILEIEKKLEDQLGLKVTILNKKNNSGKVTIEYKNLEQFALISAKLKSD